jgi:hypothetical protein
MREIIHQYGGFLVEAAVFIALIALLFVNITDADGNKGIINIVSAHTRNDANDYASYTDFDVYVAESGAHDPQITFTSETIHVGGIDPADSFSAFDSEGNALPVVVLSVRERGKGYIEPGDDGEFYIPNEGVYTFCVRAVDRDGRESVCEVDVPVNREEE